MAKAKNPNAKFTGVDIDPKVREIALHKLKKQNLSVPLDLYNGKKLPYDDNKFDKIYSCLVFHQLDAETKLNCLKQLNRVLKPNGKLIIADWGKASNKLMRFSFGFVQLLDGFKTTSNNVKGLMSTFIKNANFLNVVTKKSINTLIGTFSYYTASKNMGANQTTLILKSVTF